MFRRGSAFLSALDTTTAIRTAHQKAVGSHALLLGPMCFLGNLKVEELYQRDLVRLAGLSGPGKLLVYNYSWAPQCLLLFPTIVYQAAFSQHPYPFSFQLYPASFPICSFLSPFRLLVTSLVNVLELTNGRQLKKTKLKTYYNARRCQCSHQIVTG